METLFSGYVKFPAREDFDMQTLDRMYKLLGSIEQVEKDFDIEFSCGDEKYLSDIENDMEELDLYDGYVCPLHPPRYRDNLVKFSLNKNYLFEVKSYGKKEPYTLRFYINNKERTRRAER